MSDERMDELIGSLPGLDLTPERADIMGRRVRRAFDRAHLDAQFPFRAAWTNLWGAWLEPALTTGAVGVYLVWAFGAAAVLLGAA